MISERITRAPAKECKHVTGTKRIIDSVYQYLLIL